MNEPFDMLTFANRLLAGMAARHSPATDEESDQGERWNAETREEYEQYLKSTEGDQSCRE